MDRKFTDVLNSINTEILDKPDVDLIENGILDSIAIMELVAALEKAYDFEFDPDDITPENFATSNSLWSLVQTYLQGQGNGTDKKCL